MSFGDDIRRISKYAYLLKLVRQAQSTADQLKKDAILGKKSTVLINGVDGTSSAAATAAASGGTIKTPSGGGNTSDTAADVAGDIGSSVGTAIADAVSNTISGSVWGAGGGGGGGSTNNTNSPGAFDANSVIKGVKDVFGKNPPSIGDLVTVLTGLKLPDGNNLITYLQDYANSFVPGEGFVNPFTPVPDSTWQNGYYWAATNFAGSSQASTPGTAGFVQATSSIGTVTGLGVIEDVSIIGFSSLTTTAGAYDVTFKYRNTSTNVIEYGFNRINVNRLACVSPGVPSAACTAFAPNSNDWGYGLPAQLAWVTPLTALSIRVGFELIAGRFAGSPLDPKLPKEYREGMYSILDVDTTAGVPVRIGPLDNGGFYIYERNPTTGLPVGSTSLNSVAIVKQNHTFGGYITPASLATQLPK